MLKGVHVLLSYTCLYRCEHCFLHCGPASPGTFSLARLTELADQAKDTGTVTEFCFEGGEAFLFYPLLVRGVALAKERGFETGVLTNAYWAVNDQDAELWLKPLMDAGLDYLGVSDDAYHHDPGLPSPARRAAEGAKRLGLATYGLTIDEPEISVGREGKDKGKPIVEGGVRFRGRAADELTVGLPTRPWTEFTECPDEDLLNPERVHIGPYGTVHICQGISIGNVWEKSLSGIMAAYDGTAHPICGPLSRQGPAGLVQEHGLSTKGEYVDACHLCYRARQELRGRFPRELCPGQAYGCEPDCL